MADILKPKRGMHTTIHRINPILADGEIVFEKKDSEDAKYTGEGLIKMGDGVTPYNDLPVFIEYTGDVIHQSEKGAQFGVAPLNNLAKIDQMYLPAYVDDVLEFPSFSEFPQPGESGIIYVDTSQQSNNIYRWSGTQYIVIASSVTYTMVKDGSSIQLRGSDGSVSTVSNVGGVEIRSNEPSTAELYPGKMWIVRT